MLREHSNCLAIALTLSPLRAITRISTACSWFNINSQKAVILAQVGHFYFGAVGQYYFGANKQVAPRHVGARQRWLACRIHAVNGKDVLCKVDAYGYDGHGLPLSSELMRFRLPIVALGWRSTRRRLAA